MHQRDRDKVVLPGGFGKLDFEAWTRKLDSHRPQLARPDAIVDHDRLTVNGRPLRFDLDPQTPLLWALRDAANLTGTKYGCGVGDCGACMVLVDGKPRCAAAWSRLGEAEGRVVTTIEGLSHDRSHPVQQALVAEQAIQCGFCTPGHRHRRRRAAGGQRLAERGRDQAGDPQLVPLRSLSAAGARDPARRAGSARQERISAAPAPGISPEDAAGRGAGDAHERRRNDESDDLAQSGVRQIARDARTASGARRRRSRRSSNISRTRRAATSSPSSIATPGWPRARALRTYGTDAEERGLTQADADTVLDAMIAEPRLIERPLVETEKGVRLCRPPERVEEIL